jgi:hypothetical protein
MILQNKHLLAYYGVAPKYCKIQLLKNPEKVVLDWSLSFSKMDKYYLSKTRKNMLAPKLSFYCKDYIVIYYSDLLNFINDTISSVIYCRL